MKYNEAIDMIRNGGRATNSKEGKWWIWFAKSYIKTSWPTRAGEPGDLMVGIDEQICNVFTFNNKYLHDDNWIVEKDGVVYEEHPGRAEMITGGWKRNIPDGFIKVTLYAPSVELFKIPITQSGYKKLDTLLESGDLLIDERGTPLERVRGVKILKSRLHEQDLPAELEEGGEPWMSSEEIREALEAQFPPKPIIADEVNKDWLEKKMLCFMNKYLYIHSGMNLETKQGECSNRACPFCFPQAKPKEDLIKKTIRDMQPVPTAEEASEKAVKNVLEEANKILEQPREKVTVEDIMILIDMLFLQRQAASLDLMLALGLSEPERRFRMNDCRVTYDAIKQKLECLVSLQEK